VAKKPQNKSDRVAEGNRATREHINAVRRYIALVVDALDRRAYEHDATKLKEPEADLFAELTPKLALLTYNSKEYKEVLATLKPALDHHYAKNRHHPDHFPGGMAGMNLIDLVEMFVDWKAASERQYDGNLLKSIDSACERFKIPKMLAEIFRNTVDFFENTSD